MNEIMTDRKKKKKNERMEKWRYEEWMNNNGKSIMEERQY